MMQYKINILAILLCILSYIFTNHQYRDAHLTQASILKQYDPREFKYLPENHLLFASWCLLSFWTSQYTYYTLNIIWCDHPFCNLNCIKAIWYTVLLLYCIKEYVWKSGLTILDNFPYSIEDCSFLICFQPLSCLYDLSIMVCY